MWQLLESIKQQLLSLLEETKTMPPTKIEQWAAAITKVEGYYPGSRAYRNNNPGNLRWSPFQAGTKGGFSYFLTYDKGWKALLHQLTIAANGKSKVYKPTDTLYVFFEKYAPSADKNNPKEYAETVAKQLAISPQTMIKDLA